MHVKLQVQEELQQLFHHNHMQDMIKKIRVEHQLQQKWLQI